MHSLRRVIIVKRVYEMKKMYCVFNNVFRFYLLHLLSLCLKPRRSPIVN